MEKKFVLCKQQLHWVLFVDPCMQQNTVWYMFRVHVVCQLPLLLGLISSYTFLRKSKKTKSKALEIKKWHMIGKNFFVWGNNVSVEEPTHKQSNVILQNKL